MDVFKVIREMVAKQMGCDESKVKSESKLSLDLGLDSLDSIELTIDIEEEFDIEIPDEDIENFITVGDVVSYVTEKIGE